LTNRTVYRLDLLERRPDALGDARHLGRQFLALDAVARHHRGEQRLVRVAVVAGAEHALGPKREDHVLRRHLVAIVELHALAQRELDRALVDPLPALGQARDRLELGLEVARDQVLEDRHLHALTDVGALAHHLQGRAGRDLLHGDVDGRPIVGLTDGEARQDEAAGGKAGTRQEAAPFDVMHVSSHPLAKVPLKGGDYGGRLLQVRSDVGGARRVKQSTAKAPEMWHRLCWLGRVRCSYSPLAPC
jgi:hypothetical protein